MINKSSYKTTAASISPVGITYYCYNKNDITIGEFVSLEYSAFKEATENKWKLFSHVNPLLTNFKITITLN
jgi:hypothetical protein